jgi:hypothetical protein
VCPHHNHEYLNLSAVTIELVWPPTVTVMSATPDGPRGAVAVHFVAVAHATLADAVLPNFTIVWPVAVAKPVPAIVTLVPTEPLAGATPVTVGLPAVVYVYWSPGAGGLIWPATVAVMSIVPVPLGALAVHCVLELQLTPVAA